MIADHRLIIVRHKRRTHKTVQYLSRLVFGLFFVLLALGVFSYTRAGVYTRTHTRVYAAGSSNLNFQARLMASGGNIVADGAYNVEFNLYSASAGGVTQWTETQNVTVKNGYLSANLGSVSSFPTTIDWTQEQWLTMNVNADGEMNPRLKLTAVPFAFQAAQLAKTSGGFKSILDFTTPTANRSILLPDASGTVALSSAGSFTNNGILFGNGTSVIQSTAAGVTGQCLVATTAAAPTWGACASGLSLQGAYTAGNTITTTDAKDLSFNLADTTTDSNFIVNILTGSTSKFAVQNNGTDVLGVTSSAVVLGANTSISGSNTLTVGTGAATFGGVINANGGSVTSTGALSVTSSGANTVSLDSGTTGAVNVGTNANAKVVTIGNTTGASAVTIDAGTGSINIGTGAQARTVNLGTGAAAQTVIVGSTNTTSALTLQSGSGGVNISGATTINNNANNNVSINIGTSTGTVTIGGGTVPLVIDSTNFDVDASGAVSGVTGLTLSGAVSGGTSFTGSGNINTTGGVVQTNSTTRIDNSGNLLNIGSLTLSGAISGGTTITGTTLNGTTGINTGSGSGTQRIDNNGALQNITSLTLSGAISGGTTISGSGNINTTGGVVQTNSTTRLDNSGNLSNIGTLTLSGAISGGTSFTGSGNVNTTGGVIQTNSTTRIDNSGNLTNIGNVSGSAGLILSSGGSGDLTLDSASNKIVIAADDTTLQHVAAGTYTVDLKDAGATVLKLTNTGTGISDLNIDEGSLLTAGTSRLTNSGALQNISTLTLSGAISGGTTISGSGNINTTGGVIQTNSTTRLDNSGNLSNIGTLTLSGAISGGTTYSGSGNINTTGGVVQTNSTTRIDNSGALQNITSLTLSGAISGGTSFSGSGNINTTGGVIQTNSTDRIDNTGNLVNIGNITGASALTLKSGGTGALSLNTSNQSAASTASAGITLKSGDASGTGVTSNSGNIVIDSGSSTNGTTGLVQIGTNNASGLTLSRSGITTTVGGTLVVSGASTSIGTTILAGTLTLSDGSSNTGLFQTSALGSNRTYTLPDSTGTVCLDSNNCGYIQLGPSSVQTDSSTNPSLFINKTGASGNIVTLQKSGTGVFTIANGGATQISTTSTGAFNVSNASSATSFFNIDTSGNILQVGSSTGDATGILFVLDSKTGTDPVTGVVNGAQYYNSTDNKFRCYQNGSWKDCGGSYIRSFIDTTSDAAIDANTTNYWDTAAENNNSFPNIVLTQASGKAVMGIVTMEMTPTSNVDTEITGRVERGIGSVPTCGSGTPVGGQPGVFATNTGATKSNTVTFVDTPNTTSTVYYVLCSDNSTVGTNGNITRIRITLQEVENNN